MTRDLWRPSDISEGRLERFMEDGDIYSQLSNILRHPTVCDRCDVRLTDTEKLCAPCQEVSDALDAEMDWYDSHPLDPETEYERKWGHD